MPAKNFMANVLILFENKYWCILPTYSEFIHIDIYSLAISRLTDSPRYLENKHQKIKTFQNCYAQKMNVALILVFTMFPLIPFPQNCVVLTEAFSEV